MVQFLCYLLFLSSTFLKGAMLGAPMEAPPPPPPYVSAYFCLPEKGGQSAPTCTGPQLLPDQLKTFEDLYPPAAPRKIINPSVTLSHFLVGQSTSRNANQMLPKSFIDTQKLSSLPNILYWSYVYKVTNFGGSLSEGQILVPDRNWIKMAHKNNSLILGTIFLPPDAYGGDQLGAQIDWLLDPTSNAVDSLLQVAMIYGFDGYFINAESSAAAARKPDFGNFISRLKQKALEANYPLHMEWYVVGGIAIEHTLVSASNEVIADSAFIDHFVWGTVKSAWAGLTQAQRDAFGVSRIEFGAYSQSEVDTLKQGGYFANGSSRSIFTLNGMEAPNNEVLVDEEKQDENLRNYWEKYGPDLAKSRKTKTFTLPFNTDFNTGKGEDYYVGGVPTGFGAWNAIDLQSPLPELADFPSNVSFDYKLPYNGGSSLLIDLMTPTELSCCCLPGKKKIQETVEFLLFDKMGVETKGIPLQGKISYAYSPQLKKKKQTLGKKKGKQEEDTEPSLCFNPADDGNACCVRFSPSQETLWNTLSFKINDPQSNCHLTSVNSISLKYTETKGASDLNLGHILLKESSPSPVQGPLDVKTKEIATGGYVAKWDPTPQAQFYELYLNGVFAGATSHESFWLTNITGLKVLPVYPDAHQLPASKIPMAHLISEEEKASKPLFVSKKPRMIRKNMTMGMISLFHLKP